MEGVVIMKYQIYYCNANTKDKTKKIKKLYNRTCSSCHKSFNTTDSFKTCKKCRGNVAKSKQAHKGFYIYTVALKSDLNNVLYVGSTTYLSSRMSAHKCCNVPGTSQIFKDNPLSDIVIKVFNVAEFINNTTDLVNLEYATMWFYHRPLNNNQYKNDWCFDAQGVNEEQLNQVNQFLKMISNKEFNIWNWR